MIHSLRLAGVVLLVAGLGACASAPTHFHTLVPPSAPLPAATASFAIDVLPVAVPPQVDQPALVLRQGATGIAVLDGERWASPLGDEIRGALSADLAARLGTHDMHGLPRGKDAKVVRVQLDVRRFDSEVGGSATLEASWSVRGADGVSANCASRVSEPAGSSYDSLVEAHQRVLGTVADQVATAVRSVAAGQPATCAAI
ncbi:membrane integrity-associated transporter subunit PqiC [Luteibacter jiangsuensis]|uniref:Membrane integrity-associated transporter subunit PqiC n=1 Tax=Luteibacter jiangsuensis TaxID=637577 RepID=A0ABX0Q804_9GAMM|nr:PqiC family protein [Luteibacter jiangsuensis]NID05308.1 membrane integrity-associated transporter subunit PqiC [Luteibacter jiangsuensis]